MDMKELRRRTPEGYNLAFCHPARMHHEPGVDLMATQALPVLKEAGGVLGVLRALSIRQGDMPAHIADSDEEWTLHHLIFLPDGQATLHVTTFRLHPMEGEDTRS